MELGLRRNDDYVRRVGMGAGRGMAWAEAVWTEDYGAVKTSRIQAG
jgi:hypothetical protein